MDCPTNTSAALIRTFDSTTLSPTHLSSPPSTTPDTSVLVNNRFLSRFSPEDDEYSSSFDLKAAEDIIRHRRSAFSYKQKDKSFNKNQGLIPLSFSSSKANQRKYEKRIYLELCSLLQCPVCFETVRTPIYQCVNGHIFCHRCLPHLQYRCPICRVDVNLPTRNRILESLLSFFTFSCRFNYCNAIVPFSEMHIHERECEYKPLKCPYPGCRWYGRRDVLKHILKGHPRILNMDGEQIVFLATELDIPGKRLNWIMIQRCFNHHFLLWLERCHNYRQLNHILNQSTSDSSCAAGDFDSTSELDHFYWASVQLISTDKFESEQFRYRLELDHQGDKHHKLTWESQMKCIGQSRQEILKGNDCLVLSKKLINNFIQNTRLPLNVTIMKCSK
ncbi:hypothetical protein GJ496_001605 [Pomphorhynchus laevis]|nr:hypothetical protein GJ496_001605 [Pomphorhynchus laevis]